LLVVNGNELKYKHPRVKIELDDYKMIALKLAKNGYATYPEILSQNVEIVLEQYHYDNFCTDYENQFNIINTPESN